MACLLCYMNVTVTLNVPLNPVQTLYGKKEAKVEYLRTILHPVIFELVGKELMHRFGQTLVTADMHLSIGLSAKKEVDVDVFLMCHIEAKKQPLSRPTSERRGF